MRIAETGNYFYPDIVVTSELFVNEVRYAHAPIFLVEVLSPSTRTFDSVDKFIEYRKLSSLQYYMLVEPEYYHVTLHQKNTDGLWESDTYRKLTDAVPLAALSINLPLAEIYKGLVWE